MLNLPYALYGLHSMFWTLFAVARFARRAIKAGQGSPVQTSLSAKGEGVAPLSRFLVVVHGIGFGFMYNAIALDYMATTQEFFFGQRLAGACIIVAAALLSAWALLHFRSWRLRAKLDAGHQLATDGPFRFMRHPIYVSFNLLALGTAIWLASDVMAWIGFVLVAAGGVLRSRAEETLLRQVFGAEYENYCARTSRFIPGIY